MTTTFHSGDRVLMVPDAGCYGISITGTVDEMTPRGAVWVLGDGLDGARYRDVWLCSPASLVRLPVDLHAACPYCGADEPTIDVEDRDDAVGYSAIETRCAACWPHAEPSC